MINRDTLEPALLAAVTAKQYEVVEAYLRNGAQGTALSDGNSALHVAVLQNDLKMIVLLLKYDTDPSIKNAAGQTPIVLATNKGFWDCVITFANARKEDSGKYKYGNALLVAAEKNHLPAVEALLKAGAVTTWYHPDNGNRALHDAASHNNSHMVSLLLQHGADLSIKNTAGETPIVLAAKKDLWDCVITFANTRKDNGGKYEYGNALRLAAYKNHYKAVKALLEAGASTSWSHRNGGDTPLHDAVRHHNAAMVALLKLYKADPGKQNAQHETPVLLASKHKFWDCSLAFVEPHKFLVKEASDIQLVLFYLFTANKNPANPFSRIPYEVLKLILNLVFNYLSPDLYTYEVARTQYVTLRSDRKYICSASNFIKNYSQFGILRPQSIESVAFVKSLEKIVATREQADKRAAKVRQEITAFTAQKINKTSRAVTLLIQYNLFQIDPTITPVPEKEKQPIKESNMKNQ
jgi:ankyrin repeat protein